MFSISRIHSGAIKRSLVLIICCLLTFLIYDCKQNRFESEYVEITPLATHDTGLGFVGSENCHECHKEIYETYIHTAHYLTSSSADTNSVKGSFTNGSNALRLSELLSIAVIKTDSGLFQKAHFPQTDSEIYTHRMDITIGSGTKGQSYLTWNENALYQLQVSYFEPLDTWINSPGARPGVLSKLRPVNNRCLECHTTFAKGVDNSGLHNTYDKDQLILAIDCERCHGPLQQHVAYHRNNRDDLEPRHVIRYDSLLRQQRLDMCALCHSGVGTSIEPPFSYLVGEPLNDYLTHSSENGALDSLDVHSNQYGLLRSSKCFQMSKTLDCATCHDPHKNQRGNTQWFNAQCISCHSAGMVGCAIEENIAIQNQNDCIKCHMPLFNSKTMTVQISADSSETAVKVRTHKIGIYPPNAIANAKTHIK